MLDLDEFLKALGQAHRGVRQGCSSTARAAMRRAHAEILAAINATRGQLRAHADTAFAYVDNRRQTCKSMSDEIGLLYAFWYGFNRGWRGERVSDPFDEDHEAGFDFGRYGALRPFGETEEITLDIEIDDSG